MTMEQYEYLDCLIDFNSAIEDQGAGRVADDFRRNYNTNFNAFMKAATEQAKARQVAALFRPVIPKTE